MPWNWRYESVDGQPVTGPAEAFSSQADAESWLGENWRELAEAGVAQVTLLDAGAAVYGPMSLDSE